MCFLLLLELACLATGSLVFSSLSTLTLHSITQHYAEYFRDLQWLMVPPLVITKFLEFSYAKVYCNHCCRIMPRYKKWLVKRHQKNLIWKNTAIFASLLLMAPSSNSGIIIVWRHALMNFCVMHQICMVFNKKPLFILL